MPPTWIGTRNGSATTTSSGSTSGRRAISSASAATAPSATTPAADGRQRVVAHDRELRRVPDVGQQQHRREQQRAGHRKRAPARVARKQRAGREQHRDDGAGLRQRTGEGEQRRHRHGAPSVDRAAPRSSSLWRDAVSASPPGHGAARRPVRRAARDRLRQRRHDRRRRQRTGRRAARYPRARSRPPSTRATRRSAASLGKGIEPQKDARAGRQTRHHPGHERRVRRVRRHTGRGGGHPDSQRGRRAPR